MPLLAETYSPVSPLPLPTQLHQLNPQTEVWLISQTAEIFTDYESYANRYSFYSQPLFISDLPGSNQLVSFFEALNLENSHLDYLIHSKFPSSLKSRLLSSIYLPSSQSQPNIDHLVDHLYGLYHRRFDVNERVSADLAFDQLPSVSSSVYDARVIRVFPPKPIRDLDKNGYSDLIHLQSVDRFKFDLAKSLEIDDADAYLYTIQLIDDTKSKSDNFGASYMEVETKKLSRHSDSFSKPLLKRFLQSVILPYSPTSPSPRWVVQPDILLHPDSSTLTALPAIPVPSHKLLIKHLTLNEIPGNKQDLLEPLRKKRKKNTFQCPPSQKLPTQSPDLSQTHSDHASCDPKKTAIGGTQPSNQKRPLKCKVDTTLEPRPKHPKKKQKPSEPLQSIISTPANSQPDHALTSNSEIPNPSDPSAENPLSATTPITATKESKKSIKYPIEDLDLDPLTVIDGRYLRRANPIPFKLPKKPQLVRPKLGHKFAQKLKIWSLVNIFRLNERRCRFEEFDDNLDDLTACLVKLILRQSHLRYPNTSPNRFTSISVLPFFATRPAQESSVMSIDEQEYWVRKGLRFLNISLASNAHKKTLNRGTVEEDWVMGLVEIMCHRGGIERLGCTARMFKYFFSTDATLLTIDHTCDEDTQVNDTVARIENSHPNPHTSQINPRHLDFDGDSPLTSNIDESDDDQDNGLTVEEAQTVEDKEPETGAETGDEDGRRYGRSIRSQRDQPKQLKKTLKLRYEGLPVEDKLTLIDFLCDIAMESDKVRNYLEECDEKLTVVRKEKADVNKDKRKVLEELSRLETLKAASTPKLASFPPVELASSRKDCELSPVIADQSKPNGFEVLINNPLALPTELSDRPASQPSTEPDEDTKPMLLKSKPISPTLSLDNSAVPADLHCQSSLPQIIKPNIKKLEMSKQPSNRPMVTPVRIATLAARQIKQSTCAGSNEYENEKQQLENQLFEIGLRELQLQERFRQFVGVSKLKPLGVDRFYCKYWWFDGIGGMEVHSEDEPKRSGEEDAAQGEMKWYSGCLFVSGPCVEEWDKICKSYGGYDHILRRRLREEFGCVDDEGLMSTDEFSKDMLIGVDQWGIYETEEQIEELMNWLNAKGSRENALKMSLRDWREYITEGIQDRVRYGMLKAGKTKKGPSPNDENGTSSAPVPPDNDHPNGLGFDDGDSTLSLISPPKSPSYHSDSQSS